MAVQTEGTEMRAMKNILLSLKWLEIREKKVQKKGNGD